MAAKQMFHWGSEDRQMVKHLRRMSQLLELQNADFIELAGLDHAATNEPRAIVSKVLPAVDTWLTNRLGDTW